MFLYVRSWIAPSHKHFFTFIHTIKPTSPNSESLRPVRTGQPFIFALLKHRAPLSGQFFLNVARVCQYSPGRGALQCPDTSKAADRREVRAANGPLQIIVLDHAGIDVWGGLASVGLTK